MENQEILEEQWDNTPETMKEKRGNFLLVICILTWSFCGIFLITTVMSFINGKDKLIVEQQLSSDQFDQQLGNEMLNGFMADTKQVMIDTIEYYEEINFGLAIILLIGGLSALLMFNLKKIGYLLYIVYTISFSGLYFYYLGTSTIVWISQAIYILIGVVFVILYSINLKRMTE